MEEYAENGHERLNPELRSRLAALRRAVPPSEIGELWVFPPLDEPEGTREFFLFTRMAEEGARRLYTARVPPGSENGHAGTAASGNGEGAGNGAHGLEAQEVTEHGRVPAGRIPGLVERFRRRLEEEREPIHVHIDGSEVRWERFLGLDGVSSNGSRGAAGAAGTPDGERRIERPERDR